MESIILVYVAVPARGKVESVVLIVRPKAIVTKVAVLCFVLYGYVYGCWLFMAHENEVGTVTSTTMPKRGCY